MKRLVGGTYKASLCDRNFKPDAVLYTIDKSSDVQLTLKHLYASTGKDWYQKKNKFYHNTMCDFDTAEYDWNPRTGELCK